jgi:transcriptional regulator with XRE-family HTH domain
LARDLTFQDLAELSGLHYSYWSKLESSQIKSPAPKYLRIIAKTLDVPISDIYALSDYAMPENLPGFQPYLRAKYNFPPEAVAQLEGYFRFLRDYYGIPDDQPVYPPKPKTDDQQGGIEDRRAA